MKTDKISFFLKLTKKNPHLKCLLKQENLQIIQYISYIVQKGIPVYFFDKKVVKNIESRKHILNEYQALPTDISLCFECSDIKLLLNSYLSNNFSAELCNLLKRRMKKMKKHKAISQKTLNNFRKLYILSKFTQSNQIQNKMKKFYEHVLFNKKKNFSLSLDYQEINSIIENIERFNLNEKQKAIFNKLIVLYNLSKERENVSKHIINLLFNVFYKKYNLSIEQKIEKYIDKTKTKRFSKGIKFKLYKKCFSPLYINFIYTLLDLNIKPDVKYFTMHSDLHAYILQNLITKNKELNKIRLQNEKLYRNLFNMSDIEIAELIQYKNHCNILKRNVTDILELMKYSNNYDIYLLIINKLETKGLSQVVMNEIQKLFKLNIVNHIEYKTFRIVYNLVKNKYLERNETFLLNYMNRLIDKQNLFTFCGCSINEYKLFV
ncbi:MAG: hypothetical protein N2505_00165 [Endomicrobia bacterium]|nr:hypothetical protein [Endomicrobiia bacterium]